MTILDGKGLKEEILDSLKNEVSTINDKITLDVIQIGDDFASGVYINQKKKMCEYIGYGFNHIKLDENVTEEEVIELIESLNNDEQVSGILLQLPIPKHLDENKLINYIDPNKDVDGLTDINMGKLVHGKDCLVSCTPLGIITLLDKYNIDLVGTDSVIVGRSNLVGKPLANLLINRGSTVTVCNSKTRNLRGKLLDKDIVIAATGKMNLIKKDMIKNNAVVIDVGITRNEEGKLCGDVDFENVKDVAGYITPVPGGVGPMTIASLANNVLQAYKVKKKSL